MAAAAIVTLVGVAIIVIALATYLTIIAYTLSRASFTLGTVLIGVRSIANQTEPVGEVVAGILEDVEAIDGALKSLLGTSTPAAREHASP
ncbi:MAG: hypothetical protein ACRD0U_12130 [Acidimicrobiales bacterium]